MKIINRTFTIFLLPLIMSLTACSKAPGCADEATVNLVKDIALDRMRDVLTNRYSSYADTFSYKYFKDQISKGAKHLEDTIKMVDADISKIHIEVEGIRTLDSQNPKQIRCAATATAVGPDGRIPANIEYVAQQSDDGKSLHIQVEGL